MLKIYDLFSTIIPSSLETYRVLREDSSVTVEPVFVHHDIDHHVNEAVRAEPKFQPLMFEVVQAMLQFVQQMPMRKLLPILSQVILGRSPRLCRARAQTSPAAGSSDGRGWPYPVKSSPPPPAKGAGRHRRQPRVDTTEVGPASPGKVGPKRRRRPSFRAFGPLSGELY
ncbi:hypothetical protein NL676_036119 [Syzygium grande]|nr:hypothetical protein NL676_036119 [Syzygium grande]